MKYIEQVSYTLWNPREIIEKNGGIPPQTFKIFEVPIYFIYNLLFF